MRLSDIFDQLTYGELAQVAISGNNSGLGIQVVDYPKMVAHVNLGLTELHKRFPLKRADVIIQEATAISTYFIDIDYAVSNTGSAQPVKYLIDTEANPFEENLLKIESIVDDAGDGIALNDCTDEDSIFTPSYNSIIVPVPDPEVALTISYRANHRKISAINLTPSAEEIEIPNSHLQPLLYFIASRVLTALPNMEETNIGLQFMAKFEAACAKIIELDIMNKETPTNTKLCDNGWV